MTVKTETTINKRPTDIDVLKKLGRLYNTGSKLVFSYSLTTRAEEKPSELAGRKEWSEPDTRRHYSDYASFADSDQILAANAIREFNDKRRSRGFQTGQYAIRLDQKTHNIVGGFCTTKIELTIERFS